MRNKQQYDRQEIILHKIVKIGELLGSDQNTIKCTKYLLAKGETWVFASTSIHLLLVRVLPSLFLRLEYPVCG